MDAGTCRTATPMGLRDGGRSCRRGLRISVSLETNPVERQRRPSSRRLASRREGQRQRLGWNPKVICSPHTTLKHPRRRDTEEYDEGTSNCPSFRRFFARSEGYRHSLKTTHNPKVARGRDSTLRPQLGKF